MPGLHVFEQRAGKPRGGLAERLGRRVAVPERHQRLVTPEHLDERGAGVIRLRGHGTHERGGIERDPAVGKRADDEQPLPGLQVQPDADHQFGIAAERDFIHVFSARRS